MMYSFAKPEAVRSFREAWKRDPECAICYWGEAWAWGSYLNAPMNAEEAPHAYAAAQKALSLKSRATPKERALIDAMAVRYVEKFDAAKRVEQDRAYADAMQKVSAQYPDDLEIATLYADALFLLEPRRGTRDVNDPNVQRLHQVLESILARDVHHPGACHLYVHATESTIVPGRAEACAEFLGRSIPGASHINHMPSHTWNEVGRWGDSVRANLEAWHSDQKAAIGEGFAIYPEHNLHMLLYAASYDGQGAIAMRAGKDYTKLTGESFYEVLTLIRFGRFDEVLAGHEPAEAGDPGRALGLRAGLRAPQTGARRFRQRSISGASRRRPRHRRRRSASTRRRTCSPSRPASSRARFSGRAGDLDAAPSRRSSGGRARRRRSSTTSRSRCRSRRSTGSAPRSSKRSGSPRRRRRIAPSSRITRTTAGRCSACKQALEGMGQQSSDVAADLAASWSRVGHLDPVVALLSAHSRKRTP